MALIAIIDKFIIYAKNFLYIIICIAAIAVIISGLALGITDIVIGAKFLHNDCTNIHELPTYIIVFGVFNIINFIIFCKKQLKGEDDYLVGEYLLMFISIGISIWGMTLVWNTERGDCPSTLYNYAYYRTFVFVFTMTAIFASFMSFITFGCMSALCCNSWLDNCIKKESDSDSDSDINVTNDNTKQMPPGVSSESFNAKLNQEHAILALFDKVLNTIDTGNSTVVNITPETDSNTDCSTA
jgi:hypothetical protein